MGQVLPLYRFWTCSGLGLRRTHTYDFAATESKPPLVPPGRCFAERSFILGQRLRITAIRRYVRKHKNACREVR